MNTGIKALAITFSAFVIMTVFFFDFFAYSAPVTPIQGQTTQPQQLNLFPNSQSYLNWTAYLQEAQAALGGHWAWVIPNPVTGGVMASISFDWLLNAIAYPVAGVEMIGGGFTYIGVVAGWLFGAANFPFSHLVYPFNYLFDAMIIMMFSFSILFAIRIVSSGIGGGRD